MYALLLLDNCTFTLAATADLLYIHPKQKDGALLGKHHHHSPNALLSTAQQAGRDRFIKQATTMSLQNKLEYDKKKLADIQKAHMGNLRGGA